MSEIEIEEGVSEDLYPIAILIDELKHDDVQCRLNSMKKLDTIAIALGQERTRTELLPFIAEGVDDDDEVLSVMAEQLGPRFIPHVGGPEYAYVLLEPLEVLATVEETSVREKAIVSMNGIMAQMPTEHVLSYGWPIVRGLGTREWFTSRTSACALLAHVLGRIPSSTAVNGGGKLGAGAASSDGKDSIDEDDSNNNTSSSHRPTTNDVFELFQQLCGTEEVPMVRRAAAACLADVGTSLAGGVLGGNGVGGKGSSSSSSSESKGGDDDEANNRHSGEGSSGAAANSSSSSSSSSSASSLMADAAASPEEESVPPAVPKPITVSCASQKQGSAAAMQLLPLLQAFAVDEQDGVRLLAVDGCVGLARLVNGGMISGFSGMHAADAAAAKSSSGSSSSSSSTTTSSSSTTTTTTSTAAEAEAVFSASVAERDAVLSVVIALCADNAWRVRWSVANRLSELADAFGPRITVDTLLPRFLYLLGDVEAEVRTAASYRVADMGKCIGRQRLLEHLAPAVDRLSEDPSEHVRAALSSVVLGLASVLGTEATTESLLPLFLRLLKDSSSSVRLNIISKLEALNAVIGLKMLSQSLLPAIQDLSADKSWRVRQAIIDFTPLLARQLGSDIFDSSPELTDLCLAWLKDSVYCVRESATLNLKKLAEVFGASWADRILIPRILASQTDEEHITYQLRVTTLQAMVMLGEAVGPPLATSRLLPAVVAQAHDAVPNVRFNVAKALDRLSKCVEQSALASSVKPCLTTLAGDRDADVRFYASKALESIG